MTTITSSYLMPALPYEIHALEPQISRETMDFHYNKHLKAYVDNLNQLIEGSKYEGASLEDIIRYADGPIFNNGAQVWNHAFFFNTLSANSKTVPTGILGEAINRDFESFDKLKERFFEHAKKLFGSGWVWLVKDTNRHLLIISTSNAANPMSEGYIPLMCVDVWEHAYYIDHRNRRMEGVESMWSKTDWRVVEERFRKNQTQLCCF